MFNMLISSLLTLFHFCGLYALFQFEFRDASSFFGGVVHFKQNVLKISFVYSCKKKKP